jgi:probable F420-dependent oxidoreductase
LPFPDTFVVLAALGAHTQTIKLGTSVIVVPYRNPLPVAKAVATVDMATSGRYLFGVGVGWLAEEFEALGEKFSERGSRTREYLQVMKAVWQEEAASFEGKYFSFPDLYALPLPVQKPHPPIIFGGESMPALKRVADLGDGWQPGPVPLETLRERMGQLRELMAERGRDFSQLSISMLGDVKALQENPDTLAALGELGVQEMVLFMATLDTDKTLAQLEEAANAFMS